MAKHHFVVFIDQKSWRVAHFVGAQFAELRQFDPVADDLMAWLAWCEPFQQAVISFLTNLADEHYHVETLPHVTGSAGRQLLMRKVSAWPFAQGMHAIVRLDTVRALRREDRFLFTALGDPNLSNWLSRLATPLPNIQGVYTLVLSMPDWLPPLPNGIVHRLCIQCTKQQVRISYFQRKRLFFNRLIPVPQTALADPYDWFSRIAQEAGQLRTTFIQQRWMHEPEVFEVMWLGEVPQDVDIVKKHLPSHGVWTCIPMPELKRQLDCKRLPDGMDVMDWAATQSILHSNTLPNLAPPKMLLTNSLIRMKRGLHWAGAVITGLMLLAGYVGVQATQQHRLKVHSLDQQLAEMNPVKPYSDIRPESLSRVRALRESVQAVQSNSRLPDHALMMLTQVLSGIQSWQLTNIEWQCHGRLGQTTNDGSANTLSGCQETLTVSWSTVDLNDEASMEWQEMINRLKSHPEVEQVEVMNASSTVGGAQRQGSTRQQLSTTPMLKVYVRSIAKASVL